MSIYNLQLLSKYILFVYVFLATLSFRSPILTLGNITLFDFLLLFYVVIKLSGTPGFKSSIVRDKSIFVLFYCFMLVLLLSSFLGVVSGTASLERAVGLVRYLIFPVLIVSIVDYVGYSFERYKEISFVFIFSVSYFLLSELYYSVFISRDFNDSILPIVGKSSLWNKNDIAAIGGVSFPVIYSLYIIMNNSKAEFLNKVALLTLFISIFLITVFTHSKTGWFPLFIFCLFVLYYSPGLIRAFFLIIAVSLLVYNWDVALHVYSIMEGKVVSPSSWEARIYLKYMALVALSENPLFGTGWGGYYLFAGIDNPHDFNMQILAEGGIISFFCYLSILYVFGRKIIDNFLGCGNYYFVPALLFFIVFIVQSTATGMVFTFHTYWVAYALILSYSRIIKYRMAV